MKSTSAHPTPDRRGPVSRSLRRLVRAFHWWVTETPWRDLLITVAVLGAGRIAASYDAHVATVACGTIALVVIFTAKRAKPTSANNQGEARR